MANAFKDWTPDMVAAHNAKVGGHAKEVMKTENQSESGPPVQRALLVSTVRPVESIGAVTTGGAKSENNTRTSIDLTPQKSSEEQKLNKLETAYLFRLRQLAVPCLNIQGITLKLAWDCRLTADFTYVDCNGRLTFVDVKGFQREDALIKMKVAARMFPEFNFVIATREKGEWIETPIKP